MPYVSWEGNLLEISYAMIRRKDIRLIVGKAKTNSTPETISEVAQKFLDDYLGRNPYFGFNIYTSWLDAHFDINGEKYEPMDLTSKTRKISINYFARKYSKEMLVIKLDIHKCNDRARIIDKNIDINKLCLHIVDCNRPKFIGMHYISYNGERISYPPMSGGWNIGTDSHCAILDIKRKDHTIDEFLHDTGYQ